MEFGSEKEGKKKNKPKSIFQCLATSFSQSRSKVDFLHNISICTSSSGHCGTGQKHETSWRASIIYWMSLSIFFSRWKELHMCIQWWKKKKLHLLFIWSIWRLKKSPVSRSEGHGYTRLCDKVYDDSNQGCPLEMTNNAEHSQCLHLSLSVYLHPENQDAKLGKPYSEWPVHQISISLLPSNL